MYVQWMLNLFTRMVKDENEESLAAAIRLVDEDLPQANNYLTVLKVINVRKNSKRFLRILSHLKILLIQQILINIHHFLNYLML